MTTSASTNSMASASDDRKSATKVLRAFVMREHPERCVRYSVIPSWDALIDSLDKAMAESMFNLPS